MSLDLLTPVWYVIGNALALVNFVLLLLLLMGYQRVQRAIASLNLRLERETHRNTAIEQTALVAKARADVAEQRADASELKRG